LDSLSWAEVQRLLSEARRIKAQTIIRLLLATGIRSGEASALNVSDVDHEGRRIRVLDSKKHRHFWLPVDGETLEWIRRLTGPRRSGPLFISLKTGRRLTDQGILWAVRKPAQRAGLEGSRHVTPRTLRHFFANAWDDANGSIRKLQRILRHKHLSSTQRYLDADDQAAEEEYRRIFGRGSPGSQGQPWRTREPGYVI